MVTPGTIYKFNNLQETMKAIFPVSIVKPKSVFGNELENVPEIFANTRLMFLQSFRSIIFLVTIQ